LIRSASNAYFPQTISVISLPDRDEAVRKAVDAAWDYLEIVETREDLEREMGRAKVREALDGVWPRKHSSKFRPGGAQPLLRRSR
jgi:hypothetical protein